MQRKYAPGPNIFRGNTATLWLLLHPASGECVFFSFLFFLFPPMRTTPVLSISDYIKTTAHRSGSSVFACEGCLSPPRTMTAATNGKDNGAAVVCCWRKKWLSLSLSHTHARTRRERERETEATPRMQRRNENCDALLCNAPPKNHAHNFCLVHSPLSLSYTRHTHVYSSCFLATEPKTNRISVSPSSRHPR